MSVSNRPAGYSDSDVDRQGAPTESAFVTTYDGRTAFQHDADRILYSSEFRSLAGKTQVIAADQLGNYHNRLTHSLKVAQLAKRLTVMLGSLARAVNPEAVGPDPDLVEAAALLHDIGHPPFGHVGESELCTSLDRLAGGRYRDGFQANAQNLRIATYLSVRDTVEPRGLSLTRALLDAAIKYPWHRGSDEQHAAKHWGCYHSEVTELLWVLDIESIPDPPNTQESAYRRPVEEQIMDWADEVTYACHDVEDFYRSGLIPLDRLLSNVPRAKNLRGVSSAPAFELERFLKYLENRAYKYDADKVTRTLEEIENCVGTVMPYREDRRGRGNTRLLTSSLINVFMGKSSDPEARPLALVPVENPGSSELTRNRANLQISEDLRRMASVLKQLIRCYVIDRQGLATQQQGQRRIIGDLVDWYSNDPKRLLPPSRVEEYEKHGDGLRAAADAVASMTESEAIRVHQRMAGLNYGQLTDLI